MAPRNLHRPILAAVLWALGAAAALDAAPVSRHEVLAAIAVLERDVTGPGAKAAAETVVQFGRESDAVLLIVGPETLPWLKTDAPPAEASARAMLMAAYFAGDIQGQLRRGAARDDPYRGWLAAIRAYGQLRRRQPELVIPEIEELIRKQRAGTLEAEAEAIRREHEDEQRREPRHVV